MFLPQTTSHTIACLSLSIHLFLSSSSQPHGFHLGLVVDLIFRFTFGFEGINYWFILPASFVGQTTDLTILATRFQLQYSQSRWDNHSLLAVVRVWDTIKHLQSVESFHTTLGLVRDHTSHHLEQTLAGASEMVGTFGRLRIHPFPQVFQNLQLVTIEVTRDANTLTSYNHD